MWLVVAALVTGWAVPEVVPVPQATRVFDKAGAVQDELVEP